MTDDENEQPDPFYRFYQACDAAYHDHMALATSIRMSRDTWFAFVRHWPRYHRMADAGPVSLSHPVELIEPVKGAAIPVTEDNGITYGELFVVFNNPHNRPANYTQLIIVMKGWER